MLGSWFSSWKCETNRAQTNNLLHFLAFIRYAVPAQLSHAQAALSTSEADKLKLQEELEYTKRASEADKLKLQGELKGADGLLESTRTENRALQAKLDLAQQSASVPDPAIGTGDVPAMMGRWCSS